MTKPKVTTKKKPRTKRARTHVCAGPWCKAKVVDPLNGRPRKYCSDDCRQRAYRERRSRLCGALIVVHVKGTPDVQETRCDLREGHTGGCEGILRVRTSWSEPLPVVS